MKATAVKKKAPPPVQVYRVGLARGVREYADIHVIATTPEEAEAAAVAMIAHEDGLPDLRWRGGDTDDSEEVLDAEVDTMTTVDALRTGAYDRLPFLDATTPKGRKGEVHGDDK